MSNQNYPEVPSPAACPTCGSDDLTQPLQGRRTGLYMSACRKCGSDILSRSPFTVQDRQRRVVRAPSNPIDLTPLHAASDAALQHLNARDGKLAQTREPGEEG